MKNVRKLAIAASVAVMVSGAGVAALASSGEANLSDGTSNAAQIAEARQQLIDARNNIVELEAKSPNGAADDPSMADLAVAFRTASDNYCALAPEDHDLC